MQHVEQITVQRIQIEITIRSSEAEEPSLVPNKLLILFAQSMARGIFPIMAK
jgi:hypothetical protein